MSNAGWRHFKIRLFVTGQSEFAVLPRMLSELTLSGRCSITPEIAFKQLGVSTKRLVNRSGKAVAGKAEQIGLKIRGWIQASTENLAIIVDDLEHERRGEAASLFKRYNDAVLPFLNVDPSFVRRFSVHFLVNMLEAYYFRQVAVINEVCGTTMPSHEGNVENLRHPKNRIDDAIRQVNPRQRFREIDDGREIAKKLSLTTILDDPKSCRALRTLVAWIVERIGDGSADRYRLREGEYWDITVGQLRNPPPDPQIQPLS